ncbi:carbohydrate ABC transporter membrane protein 1, CUT1 family [Amycolatopsis tolypomycina]|uniref:Carbohydrate ABC transporter membrane protein 1, CUT1 family n=1 Tax=Amycolatopsis tolypomycina TaxID=208445 RepID=A0A1H4Y5A4_9PSEU|nr:sugar ABC transporter permease [Amycolatopsis tolypomycina]SED13069.1 carbohydrate ABC transporter membrane protein 1, CUT1 family [Amycolatopsis tolypomycina]
MSSLDELRGLRRRGVRSSGRNNKAAFWFLLPWFAGLVFFTAGPIAASLGLGFTKYNLIQPPRFIGLGNFARIFTDERLHNALGVTFTYVLVSVPLQLACALGIAMLLDRGMRGLAFYRSAFYLPSLLGSSVAIAVLWRQIFGTEGLVNRALGLVGISGHGWISDPSSALSTLIVLNVWTFGAPMVIFLAGLRQIPAMYYEAAAIDGAGRWTRFRRITLPLLSPIVFFNVVLQIIHAFQSFTQAFVVSGGTGGPSDSTMLYTLYLYQQGFARFDMGYASALAWSLLLMIAGITGLNFWASRFWVFYDN